MNRKPTIPKNIGEIRNSVSSRYTNNAAKIAIKPAINPDISTSN